MMYSGEKFFNLKDRHGLPLEIALDKIYDSNVRIDWVTFVNQAKKVKYSDKKIRDVVNEFVMESFLNKSDKQEIVNNIENMLD